MKLILIAVLIYLAFVHTLAQSYGDKYDGMDVDQALGNKRLMDAYIKCVLETGRCTPEGRDLREHITDALRSGCSRCTNPQRRGIKKVISHLINNEPRAWKQLVDKYDPKRIYTNKYEDELRAIRG